jgi:hypothetical protein
MAKGCNGCYGGTNSVNPIKYISLSNELTPNYRIDITYPISPSSKSNTAFGNKDITDKLNLNYISSSTLSSQDLTPQKPIISSPNAVQDAGYGFVIYSNQPFCYSFK